MSHEHQWVEVHSLGKEEPIFRFCSECGERMNQP